MDTLILVCVTVMGISDSILAIPNPPDPHYAFTHCTVHDTLKEAAMAEFNRRKGGTISVPYNHETESVTYYKIDLKEKTMMAIQTPRIRIEVDEK